MPSPGTGRGSRNGRSRTACPGPGAPAGTAVLALAMPERAAATLRVVPASPYLRKSRREVFIYLFLSGRKSPFSEFDLPSCRVGTGLRPRRAGAEALGVQDVRPWRP